MTYVPNDWHMSSQSHPLTLLHMEFWQYCELCSKISGERLQIEVNCCKKIRWKQHSRPVQREEKEQRKVRS